MAYFYISCGSHSFLIYYYMFKSRPRTWSPDNSDEEDFFEGVRVDLDETQFKREAAAEAAAKAAAKVKADALEVPEVKADAEEAAEVEAAAREQFEANGNKTVEKVYRVMKSPTLWAICFATGCAIYAWKNSKLTEPDHMGGGKTVRKYKRKSKGKGKGKSKSKKGRN
jgi:hypothetical protein